VRGRQFYWGGTLQGMSHHSLKPCRLREVQLRNKQKRGHDHRSWAILLYAGTSVVKNLEYPLLPSVERVKMHAVRTISRKLSDERILRDYTQNTVLQ